MAEIEENTTGPGNLLSKARKKAGLSLAAIAEQLNLSIEIIKQLESDQYKGDVPDAFIRGYLRTYARALEQDEEQIIALYSQAIGSTIVSNHFVPSNDVPPGNANKNNIIWFIIPGVAIILAIIIYGWMAFQNDEPETSSIESNAMSDTAPKVEQQVNTSTSEDSNLEATADTSPDTTISEEEVQQPTIEEQPTAIPSGFVESPVLTDAELEISFVDDCWVQIIDSNEEVLAVGLKTAGRRFTVNGVPPIQVVLGKPRAVNIQFNNESIDLSIYPASQTARFSLSKEILEQL